MKRIKRTCDSYSPIALHNLTRVVPTVKFVALSDDILIYAKIDHTVFVLDQWDQWVFVLDQWVFVLDHRVFVLDQWVFGLDQWVFVLDHRVFGLRSSVFVFGSSFSTHPSLAIIISCPTSVGGIIVLLKTIKKYC